jgi:hypothetical protein
MVTRASQRSTRSSGSPDLRRRSTDRPRRASRRASGSTAAARPTRRVACRPAASRPARVAGTRDRRAGAARCPCCRAAPSTKTDWPNAGHEGARRARRLRPSAAARPRCRDPGRRRSARTKALGRRRARGAARSAGRWRRCRTASAPG